MSRFADDPPFERGKTFHNGDTPPANAGNSYATPPGSELEGREFWFPDVDWTHVDAVKPHRSHRMDKVRCVRNVSGAAVLPKRTVKFTVTDARPGSRIAGLTTADFGRGFLVDEFLVAAGAPDGDLLYIVMEGVAKGVTANATAIAIGDRLYASSTGKLRLATGTTLDEATNLVGRALQAVAAADTDILVDVGKA